MRPPRQVRHEFIALLPEKVEEGVLYVSLKYKNMVHLCFCGCENQVVTPLSPTGWTITFDGRSVSVYPSIGSWKLPCRSHYWIRKGLVEWAPDWTDEMVDAGFANDRAAKRDYYHRKMEPVPVKRVPAAELPSQGLFARMRRRFGLW